jgi:hypothetical protein
VKYKHKDVFDLVSFAGRRSGRGVGARRRRDYCCQADANTNHAHKMPLLEHRCKCSERGPSSAHGPITPTQPTAFSTKAQRRHESPSNTDRGSHGVNSERQHAARAGLPVYNNPPRSASGPSEEIAPRSLASAAKRQVYARGRASVGAAVCQPVDERRADAAAQTRQLKLEPS